MLIDSHCHLNRLSIPEGMSDKEAVHRYLNAARQKGVGRFLTVSVNLDEAPELEAICQEHADVQMSIGLHPCEPTEALFAINRETLQSMAQHERVIAIGETGLDYHYQSDNKLVQQQSFIEHLHAGKALKKPVIIHTREAKDDTLAILRANPAVAILHCFTEDWDMARQALDLGAYISFSGIVSFKKAIELQQVCQQVPLDRILIETDSPYLAPTPMRGKENQPAYLPYVADAVAALHGISSEALIAATAVNFERLLKEAQTQ